MICNKCGNPVENGQMFCTNCGALMPANGTPVANTVSAPQPNAVGGQPNAPVNIQAGSPTNPGVPVTPAPPVTPTVAPAPTPEPSVAPVVNDNLNMGAGIPNGGVQSPIPEPPVQAPVGVNPGVVQNQVSQPVMNAANVQAPMPDVNVPNETQVMNAQEQMPAPEPMPMQGEVSSPVTEEANTPKKKKKNVFLIVMIVIVVIVAVLGALIATNIISLDAFFNTQVPNSSIKESGNNDTDSTSNNSTTRPVMQGNTGSISLTGYTFNVPSGFDSSDMLATQGLYYVFNPNTQVAIAFALKNAALGDTTTLIDAAVSEYQGTSKYMSVVPSALQIYDEYNYYTIDLVMADGKVNTEFVIQYKDSVIFDAIAYDTEKYGKDNYFKLIFDVISSGKIVNDGLVADTLVGVSDYDFSFLSE